MNIYKYIYESGLIASGCWDKFDDYDQKALEKCIELVIRDCASVIFKEIGPKSALTVLEHFGVEE